MLPIFRGDVQFFFTSLVITQHFCVVRHDRSGELKPTERAGKIGPLKAPIDFHLRCMYKIPS